MPYIRAGGQGRPYRLVLRSAEAQRWKGWAASRVRLAFKKYLRKGKGTSLSRYRLSDAVLDVWIGPHHATAILAAGEPPLSFDIEVHLTATGVVYGNRAVRYDGPANSWDEPVVPDPPLKNGNLAWTSSDGDDTLSWEGLPTRCGTNFSVGDLFLFNNVPWQRYEVEETYPTPKQHWRVQSNYATAASFVPMWGPYLFWNGRQIRLDVPAEEAVMGAAIRYVPVPGPSGGLINRRLLLVVVAVFTDSHQDMPAGSFTTVPPLPAETRLPRDRVCVGWLDDLPDLDADERLPVTELASVDFTTAAEGAVTLNRPDDIGLNSVVSWFFSPAGDKCTAPRTDVTDPADPVYLWHDLEFSFAESGVEDLVADIAVTHSTAQRGTVTATNTVVADKGTERTVLGVPTGEFWPAKQTTTVLQTYERFVFARDYDAAGVLREAYIDGTYAATTGTDFGGGDPFDEDFQPSDTKTVVQIAKDWTYTFETAAGDMVLNVHNNADQNASGYYVFSVGLIGGPQEPWHSVREWSDVVFDWIDLSKGIVVYRRAEGETTGTIGSHTFPGPGPGNTIAAAEYDEFSTPHILHRGALVWTGPTFRTDHTAPAFINDQFPQGFPLSVPLWTYLPGEAFDPSDTTVTEGSRAISLSQSAIGSSAALVLPGLSLAFKVSDDKIATLFNQTHWSSDFDAPGGGTVDFWFQATGIEGNDMAVLFPDDFISADSHKALFPGGFV